MPVKIANGKVQFSNKPPPAPKPKPPFSLFPTKLTLQDGRGVWVSVPQPDHLTLVIDITSTIYGQNAPKGLPVAKWVLATGNYLKEQPCNAQWHSGEFHKNTQWWAFVALEMGERASYVRFEFHRQTKKLPARLRIDMNPRKLGSKGFKTLIAILSAPSGPFKLTPILQQARVSRLDVAVDLVGVQVDELLMFHPKQGKRSLYVGADGLLETVNLHRKITASKPAGNAMVRIYDRARERLDHGEERPFGPAPVTRVEVTKALKAPSNGFMKLASFNDPFADLRIGYVADQLPPTPWWHEYVGLRRTMSHHRAVELMGLQGHLPAKFSTAYDVPAPTLVSKGENWKGWSEGLQETGLSLLIDAGK